MRVPSVQRSIRPHRSTVENNLALQQRLYDLRTETKDAFDEAKSLETRWKELDKEQKEVFQVSRHLFLGLWIFTDAYRQRFTPQFLLMRLRHSTTAQDDASEALATAFVQQIPNPPPNGETGTTSRAAHDVDAFIKEFKESRKTYHKRALWGEKWASGQVMWREN